MKLIVITVLLGIGISLSVASCGAPRGNVLTQPSDAPPSGVLFSQASLAGVNGKTATGIVLLYRQSLTTFVLRLDSLLMTPESGLKLILTIDGSAGTPMSLRATGGSQNYTLKFESAPTRFQQLVIRSTLNSIDYAVATF